MADHTRTDSRTTVVEYKPGTPEYSIFASAELNTIADCAPMLLPCIPDQKPVIALLRVLAYTIIAGETHHDHLELLRILVRYEARHTTLRIALPESADDVRTLITRANDLIGSYYAHADVEQRRERVAIRPDGTVRFWIEPPHTAVS